MQRTPDLIRWLALAALAEWLIGRSLTRAAIYIPKSAPMLVAASLVSMVVPLGAWGALLYHTAMLIAVAFLVKFDLDHVASRRERWAIVVVALAVGTAHLYLLLAPAGEALGLGGASPMGA